MHDVGMIGIPDAVLLKAGRLDDVERWDGTGYPTGRAGIGIPIEARICAVVDHYDAPTMNRPYRRALPSDVVVTSMAAESGIRFDPMLVDAFMSVLPEIVEMRAEFPVE